MMTGRIYCRLDHVSIQIVLTIYNFFCFRRPYIFTFLMVINYLPAALTQNDTLDYNSIHSDTIPPNILKPFPIDTKALRMTTLQRDTISILSRNMVIFNLDENKLNIFDGESWQSIKPIRCGQPFIDPRDGQSYNTVPVQEQCWMLRNLNTNLYRNGDKISYVWPSQEWSNLTTGAWVKHQNSSASESNLYNWYAVDDSRGLCPLGWAVPRITNWTYLIDFIIDKRLEGEKINPEEKQLMNSLVRQSNTSRSPNGTFSFIHANYWTSSEFSPGQTYSVNTRYKTRQTSTQYRIEDKLTGHCVRCLALPGVFNINDTLEFDSAVAQNVFIDIDSNHQDLKKDKKLHVNEFNRKNNYFGLGLGTNIDFLIINPIDELTSHVFDSSFIPDIIPLPDSARILSIGSQPSFGLEIHLSATFFLSSYFELRLSSALAFTDRTINYEIETYTTIPGGTHSENLTISKKIPSTYLHFPLELKYKITRVRNFQAYLIAGVQLSFDLASNAKKREQNNSGEKIVKFNSTNLFINAGMGFSFYTRSFKCSMELKNMYGMFDVLKKENNIYTDGIKQIKSNIVQLILTFE